MVKFNRFNILVLIVFSLLFLLPAAASGNARVAMVIGNGAYNNFPALTNPLNDASDIATALTEQGFDVKLLTNQSHRQMLEEAAQFETNLRQGKTGLFYYAGHGVQLDGVNYLIPVDAQLQRDYLIFSEAISVNAVLGAMESSANDMNIVISVCCIVGRLLL